MELNDFEKTIYHKFLTKCEKGKWYVLDKKRQDYNQIFEALKKILEVYGGVEFEDMEFIRYRRCDSRKEISEWYKQLEIKNKGKIKTQDQLLSEKGIHTPLS